ncbi:MAG TPA: hypothetical protein VFQ05_16915 [Candidatus Eisenbacteria bacterium]|nr:hypothetical protein [Candidatus Eisenbacteria bacterium]
MFAKKFFYASAALFLLAAAYHLGASTAKAAPQTNSAIVAMCPEYSGGGPTGWTLALTATGDMYRTTASGPTRTYGNWERVGSVFTP